MSYSLFDTNEVGINEEGKENWNLGMLEDPSSSFAFTWNDPTQNLPADVLSDINSDSLESDLFSDLLSDSVPQGSSSSDSSSPDHSPQFYHEKMNEVKEGEFCCFDNSFLIQDSSVEEQTVLPSNPKKRGRPKKVPKPNESTDVSRIQMDENQLIQFNSKTYEEYVELLRNESAFTFAEEQLMKSQRRRIKNRESAQNSREKKKMATCELSARIQVLESENSELKRQLELYIHENKNLSQQLEESKFSNHNQSSSQSIQQQQQQHSLEKSQKQNCIEVQNSSSQNVTQQGQRRGGLMSKPKGVAAGAVLFAVFFSFGLFFGGVGPSASHPLSSPFSHSPPSLSPQYSSQRNLFEYSNNANLQNASNLQQCLKNSPAGVGNNRNIRNPIPNSNINFQEATKTERQVLEEWENEENTRENREDVLPSLEFIGEFMNESKKGMTPSSESVPFQSFFDLASLNSKPNTHHFVVSSIEQIFPPNASENLKDEPYKINFLIPSRSLPNASKDDNRFVQILAQVVDISFLNPIVSNLNPISIV